MTTEVSLEFACPSGSSEKSKQKKMNRERQKRSTLNDKFSELRSMLCLGDNSRVEKLKILVEAIAELKLLTVENNQLIRETNSIRVALNLHHSNTPPTATKYTKATVPSTSHIYITPEPSSPMLKAKCMEHVHIPILHLPPLPEMATIFSTAQSINKQFQSGISPQFSFAPQTTLFVPQLPQQLPFSAQLKFEKYNSDFCMDLDDFGAPDDDTTCKTQPLPISSISGDDKLLLTESPNDPTDTADNFDENENIIDSFFSSNESFNPTLFA